MILVNLRGCAARFTRAVAIGTAVELQGLPTNSRVTGRTVNCISLGEHENIWLLGVELDEPGNVWGIEAVPADWFSGVVIVQHPVRLRISLWIRTFFRGLGC